MHYVCTHNVETYSLAGHSNKAYNQQVVASATLKASNQPHPEVWLPDAGSKDFYLMNEPGDDKFDIQRGTGVCTDTHLDYGHTGCMDANGAKATMAISGCSGRAFGWSTFFCGVDVDYDEDYVTDVAISDGSLAYPRTLVEEAQVNGKTLMRVTCGDPFECQAKCERMERSARDGGLPAPSACSLCSPPCPTNIGTSLVMFVQAFRDDVVSAIQLAKICLNPKACVCQVSYMQTQPLSLLGTPPCHATGQVFMMIKPAWIDNLPNEIQECSMSDLFMLILDKVAIAMIKLLENAVNTIVIDPINSILKPIKEVKIGWKTNVLGVDIGFELKPFDFIGLMKKLCIPYKDIKDCRSEKEQADLAALMGCSFDDKSLWKRCYYERVRTPFYP